MNILTVSVKSKGQAEQLFRVAIDPDKVNMSVHSDAIYNVRAANGFWDGMKYSLRVVGNVEGAGEHGEVTEVAS